ncbi:hypothetical protein [Nocardioides astragali]|uniref:O-antigen/teichoic acid export membrane protein n=1 Tax=Nocardioides astragali TaxID=1776736 RepID=A0ABW2N4Q5_9ACTN|nr:hypothetical protein [Nocardioides astragali]
MDLRSMHLFRRVSWGIADQGVSSMGNLLLGIMVIKALDVEGFGAFSLAFVTFSFVLSASRGSSTDPLLVRFSGLAGPAWSRAVAAASGTALLTGVVTGAVCVVIGVLLPGSLGGGFIALGVGLPAILLQDSYRFAFFSQGQGAKAFVNDLLWAVLQVASVGLLLMTGTATVVTCLLAFGGSAAVAAAVGLRQSGVWPAPRAARGWLAEHGDLGGRYLVENVAVGGARQIRMFAVGAIAGLAAVGELRAAEIMLGPFFVLMSGISQVAVPEAAAVLARAPDRLRRFCFWLAVLPAGAAVLWGSVLYLVLPLGAGEALLDELWKPAAALLIPLTGVVAIGCYHNACTSVVRALGASRRSLLAQVGNAALYVLGGALGAAHSGAMGSSWGVLVASILGAVLWHHQVRAGISDHLALPREVSPVR